MSKFGRRKFFNHSAIASIAAASSSALLKACAPSDLSRIDGISTDSTQTTDSSGTAELSASSAIIRVGLLHSLSGPLAISETPIVNAELLAIKEINDSGGLLGKQLVPIKEDGASDWPTFAEKAEKLIAQDQVSVIFGGFTAASRKAILPVVTAKNHLLCYPGADEDQDCAKNIFYGGSTANQQIEPAVNWMLGNRGKNFFLVSQNDRSVHAIAKSILKEKGGTVAGEAFVPLDTNTNTDMQSLIDDIKQALPEGGIIFNSLIGEQNRVFFKALKARLASGKYLVMSTRLSETDILQIGPDLFHNHYAVWHYFQTLNTPANEKWINSFQQLYGSDQVLSAPMESAYSLVHLWAQSVRQAQSSQPIAVRTVAYEQTFSAPSGPVALRSNNRLAQPAYVGKIRDDGQFEIVWHSSNPIEPQLWGQKASSKDSTCDWTALD